MKKTPFFLLLLFALASFGFSSAPTDNCLVEEAQCGKTILSGCVGACGNSFVTSTIAPVTGFYCFDAVSSLCPTNGAQTVINIAGTDLFSGDTSGGLSLFFFANAGDAITLSGTLFEKKSDVVCFWLGEVNMTIRRP